MAEPLRTIHIDVPCIAAKFTMQFPPSTNFFPVIQQVENEITNHPSYVATDILFEEFSLFESSEVVKSSPVIPSLQLSTFQTDSFIFEKAVVKIKVRYPDKSEQIYMLRTHITISQVIEEVKPEGSEEKYELRLLAATSVHPHSPTSSSSTLKQPPLQTQASSSSLGVRMNPSRTLRSYRIRAGDVFIIKPAVTDSGFWRSVANTGSSGNLDTHSQVPVIISLPAPCNVTKSMKVSSNIGVDALKMELFKKIHLVLPPCLFELHSTEMDSVLPDQWTLNKVPMKIPIRLTCRPKEESQKARQWFGVCPTTLPSVYDSASLTFVPQVLLVLKELLLLNDALNQEGLFRRSGSESAMKALKKNIEDGNVFEITSRDVHTIATLVKRWYKELPARILVREDIDLKALVANTQTKLNLPSILSPLYARLLYWLFHICIIIMENSEATKMDSKNLAIVWGPAIVPEPPPATLGDSPFANLDFEITGYGVDVFENNLRHFKEKGIRNPVTLLPSDNASDSLNLPARTIPQNTAAAVTSSSQDPRTPRPGSPQQQPPPQQQQLLQQQQVTQSEPGGLRRGGSTRGPRASGNWTKASPEPNPPNNTVVRVRTGTLAMSQPGSSQRLSRSGTVAGSTPTIQRTLTPVAGMGSSIRNRGRPLPPRGASSTNLPTRSQ